MKRVIFITIILLWPSISFASVITFGNYNPITINDSGAASPYPSTIEVTDLSNITDVNVTLIGLTHTFPDDIYIALVGPTDASVVLMSDAGYSYSITNVILTFDNEAPSELPNGSQIVSGTYRVSQYGYPETLPAPAPSTSFGTDLSIFDGLDPNGTWSLFVFDDASLDSGSITLGWTLNFETAQVPIPGAALLLGSGLVGLVAVSRKRG
jgi:subtilisin-like proprotein convertase family protein